MFLVGLIVGMVLVLIPTIGIGRLLPSLGDGQEIQVQDDRVAFAVTVPNRLSAIDDVSSDPDPECPVLQYDFGMTNAHRPLTILAVGTECDRGSDRLMNGNHGTYRTIEDVANPIDLEQMDTDLGPAQVFIQEYEEHTNVSRSFEEPVAIVTLDDPVDSRFPTLLLRSEAGKLSRERFTEVVASLEQPDS